MREITSKKILFFYFQLTYHYFHKLPDSTFREVITSPLFEGCNFLKKSDNILIKKIFEGIKTLAPSLVHECPYEVLESYNITGKKNVLETILPSGDYKLVITYRYLDKDTIDMNVTVFLSINQLKDRTG